MKPILKTFLWFVAVMAVFIVIDKTIGFCMDKLYLATPSKEERAYKGSCEELIILGSSRASHHYIPKLITDSLNVTCFNYGKEGMNVYYYYAIASMILEYHIPNTILLDLTNADFEFCESNNWETGSLDCLYPLYYLNDTVRSIINMQPAPKRAALFMSDTYRYNQRFVSIIEDYLVTPKDYSGYMPLYSEYKEAISTSTEKRCADFNPTKIEYIRRLISLCHSKNITLVLLYSPQFFRAIDKAPFIVYAEKVSQENNIPFWNYGQDSLFLSHGEYFYDTAHLNNKGAEVYTSLVIEKLKNIISFKN